MKYNIGDVVTGKVISIKSYGAFITIPTNLTGLLHISEISHDYIKDVNSVLKIKDEVKVKIIDIDKKNRQIIFSIRALSKPKRKTKNKCRYKQHETIMESNKGFKELEKMLPIWIAEYSGGKND
ncbi:general stress protein 13 [Bacilli bacterium PM5-3]|nr:general stress protein 13 [Bacilli bacterium PM5-3]MDH6603461.1 general stress protein 13 [Bacilli bacterium PM5-9]